MIVDWLWVGEEGVCWWGDLGFAGAAYPHTCAVIHGLGIVIHGLGAVGVFEALSASWVVGAVTTR